MTRFFELLSYPGDARTAISNSHWSFCIRAPF